MSKTNKELTVETALGMIDIYRLPDSVPPDLDNVFLHFSNIQNLISWIPTVKWRSNTIK